MSYIGQQPLNNFVTKQSQTFSPDGSTTVFTLNFSVTSGVDILLVINNVVQEPGAGKSFTASGTTLTMSEAPGASDSMYCIFLGLALQTVNPGDGSVGTSKLVDSAITTAKLNSSLDLSSKTITLASNMKNTPAFEAFLSADQTGITDVTETKVQVDTESFDTDNCYDNSTNYRFTPTVAGRYHVYGKVSIDEAAGNTRNALSYIYKNGAEKARAFVNFHSSDSTDGEGASPYVSAMIDFNGTTDYVELYATHDTVNGGTGKFQGDSSKRFTMFGAYRLIGI